MDFTEMSTPSHFEKDPRLAWAFWHFRHQAYTKHSRPHRVSSLSVSNSIHDYHNTHTHTSHHTTHHTPQGL